MSDNRKRALASVIVHAEAASGDPYILDPGFNWLEELEKSWETGMVQVDSQARPLLEWLPDQGLTCRPFRIAKDTTTSLFSTSGGSWENERPGTSAPRVYHLTQYDVSDAVQYSATSIATQPANPQFAFSLILPETPAYWDAATRPPYVRVEFGSVWAVHFEKGAAFLLRKVAGTWGAVAELDSPPQGSGYEDLERFWVWVRCIDGQIGVSMDEGRTYKWYGSGLSVPAAKLTLRGQGGSVTFGLGQLLQSSGYYEPLDRATLCPSSVDRTSAVPSITGDYWLPSGVSAPIFTDRSTPLSRLARWRAAFTSVATSTGFGWSYYAAPVLRNVTFSYPVTTTTPGLVAGTIWDDYLVGVSIQEPEALDGSTATITLDVSAFAAFDWTRYRDRKITVQLGDVDTSDAENLETVFTGYIRCIHLVWDEFGAISIQITADNASSIFRRPWGVTQLRALGGQTLNSAGDWILGTEGLGTGYRAWHVRGDSIILERGHWRQLAHQLQANELKWETLTSLYGLYGLELGVRKDGTYVSVLRDSVSLNNWDRRFVPVSGSELRDLVRTASRRLDWGEMATTVQVTGQLATGGLGVAQVEDEAALSILSAAATGRFAARRRVHVEEISGSTHPTALLMRAQALGLELFPQRDDIDLVQPVDLRVSRRDQVTLYGGDPIDVADGTPFKIVELRHEYTAGKGFGELETLAYLRRR